MKLSVSFPVFLVLGPLLTLFSARAASETKDVATLSSVQPRHVYLTWQGDTSTTITINFHTIKPVSPVVYYSTTVQDLTKSAYKAQGTSHQTNNLKDGRWIHHVELTRLQPGTAYYFRAGDDGGGFSKEKKFRTIQADGSPLRFIVGGDIGTSALAVRLLEQAGKQGPQFCVIGGDIAYANANLANLHIWDRWLDNWEKYMITPDGFTIPIVAAIGNHEVPVPFGATPDQAPCYYGFLAQGGRSYFTRTFGRNVVIHLLDSGHTETYDGPQKEWLGEALKKHRKWKYRFAVYHVPLYPSHRDFDKTGPSLGREHWLPLFDQYEITTAFEHHDHTFKRTHRMKDGTPVESGGTLYLGDGCFGVLPRTVDTDRPYLAKTAGIAHFWVVDVGTEDVVYQAMDETGKVFDVYPKTAPDVPEAEAYFRTLDQKRMISSAEIILLCVAGAVVVVLLSIVVVWRRWRRKAGSSAPRT